MEEYKLSDIAEVRTGPFGSQLHNEDYWKSHVRLTPCDKVRLTPENN